MKVVLSLGVLIALVLVGCSSAADGPSSQLAAQYGLHLDGGGQSDTQTVPASLDAVPWDQIQHACREAGFDLRRYRGQELTFTSYPLKESLHGGPTNLLAIERNGSLVGAYVVVTDEAGGTYSLPYVQREL